MLYEYGQNIIFVDLLLVQTQFQQLILKISIKKSRHFTWQQKSRISYPEYSHKLCQIGRGSFASVFKVREKFGNREIRAIKKIIIDPCLDEISEVERLKTLRGDHIVQFYGYIVQNHELNMIMHYCKSNLRQKMDSVKKFTNKQVISLITQITSAMITLSNNYVMHLDLKPQNILCQNANYYKICDFGCSQLYLNLSKSMPRHPLPSSLQLSLPGYGFGTAKYIAPQVQLGRSQVGKNSCDVWSFGVILYQIVYQRHPFQVDYNGRVQSVDFSKYMASQLLIKYANIEGEYPVQLIKKMLQPQPTQRISWNKIKAELIEKYQVEQAEFLNAQIAAKSQIRQSILFASLVLMIEDNLLTHTDNFWHNNNKSLTHLKEVLIKLGYALLLKFHRIFEYKLKQKITASTLADLEFMLENFRQDVKELKIKQDLGKEKEVKILQKQLLIVIKDIFNEAAEKKNKWDSIYKLYSFISEVKSLSSFFCQGHNFNKTFELFDIEYQQ